MEKIFCYLETALSCACIDLLEPRSMIMTLVNGGAHLDFRTRNGGLTSLHKSAIHSRKEAIIVIFNKFYQDFSTSFFFV